MEQQSDCDKARDTKVVEQGFRALRMHHLDLPWVTHWIFRPLLARNALHSNQLAFCVLVLCRAALPCNVRISLQHPCPQRLAHIIPFLDAAPVHTAIVLVRCLLHQGLLPVPPIVIEIPTLELLAAYFNDGIEQLSWSTSGPQGPPPLTFPPCN